MLMGTYTYTFLAAILALSSALPEIPNNCIPTCTCKEILPNILDVVGCKSSIILNPPLFSTLDTKSIAVISFSNVSIEEISEDAFSKFPLLTDVIFKKSSIGSIEPKAFNPTNILKVKFENCNFDKAPELYARRMQELHFGSCNLDEIPRLDQLFSLKFLNLSGNFIRNIDIMTFAESFDLETLILSNNEISRIPANLFVNNADLSTLILDNNPLKYFHLNTSNEIETLSLKNCYLTSFDGQSTQRLYYVRELILSNNKLNSLKSSDLARMKELTVLDLTNNSLTSLDDDIFIGNTKLQRVTLNGNHLNTLPKFFLNNLTQFEIHTFACKNCQLNAIDKDTFKNMPALVSLNLARNHLTNIQDTFSYVISLKMLDISYNNITELTAGIFDGNRNLESLNIAGNPLMAINPNSFANTKAISKIDASNCRLYKLWTNDKPVISSIRKLLLADNQLTTLSIEAFKIIPFLEAIDLHNNPLKFDDEFCKVIAYLESRSVSPIEYSNPTVNPEDNLIDDLDNFTPNQWSDIHKKKCPAATANPQLIDFESIPKAELEDNDPEGVLTKMDPLDNANDYYNDEYDDNYDEQQQHHQSYSSNNENEDEEEVKISAEVLDGDDINLRQASYVFSITSVFIISALTVLILAVSLTLFILRQHNSFNMQKADLPRFKIPLWQTQLTQKKHSGSIYRPLSEDLSGPKTPKCSRYEFNSIPAVHTSH